ncbi:alpha/beta hydrolase [Micromonospora sp. NPDC047548]|uniref:alpha/beta hydrolase n=1 Tax=Micromonospora sp. NPDC047548 TaxID=3155624 RepID=UPI003411C01B
MTGYAQLWRAAPGRWSEAGAAWSGLADPVRRRRAALADRAAALRTGWSGGAAGAADGRLGALRGELGGLLPALIEADQVLAEFAGRLRAAKARLAEAVALADRSGVLVDRRGGVSAAPVLAIPPGREAWTGPESGAFPRPVASRAAVGQVAGGVRNALALADAADREAATRLDELASATHAGWADPPPPGRPAADADPSAVRAWWAGLTPAQRRWLVLHEPGRVGHLDGVPVAARDQANRLLLADRREALLAERRDLLGRLASGPAVRAGLRRVDAALADLDGLAGRLSAAEPPRAYLLGLDPAGDGRAIVALGNPDRADQVLTYVPGMTADLADAPGELGRAGRVLSRCAGIAPGRETAAVLWLDFDAPDFLPEAARSAQARDAGPALHRFQQGLRETHEGPPARQTVLGHSYGSVVVGAAARDHGLDADALVFVGSPGVGVDRAEALRLPPERVWASTAPDDVIRLVEPPGQLAGRAVLATSPLATAVSLLRPDDHELWFGHDPSDPGFGGRTFPSGRYGHTGYWEAGNPALDGMARIVLGR